MMTPHQWLLFVGLSFAFTLPGPCSFDSHPELDCGDGDKACPDGLACASDGYCKPEDVACDSIGGVACGGLCCGSDQVCCDDTCEDDLVGDGCDGQEGEGEGEGEGEICTGFFEFCGGRCVDTRTNQSHCGGCNTSCGESQFCSQGVCRSGDDDDCCGNSCVDCRSDSCVNRQCVGCSMIEQDCGSGATCTFGASQPPGGNCVSVEGSQNEFEACTRGGESVCSDGLDCLPFTPDAGDGSCVRYCDPTNDQQCSAGRQCLAFDPNLNTIGSCILLCTPTESFVCAQGALEGTCAPLTTTCVGDDVGGCFIAGNGAAGSPCATSLECGAGTLCDGTQCVALCVIEDTDPCPGGGTCTAGAFGCAELGACIQ